MRTILGLAALAAAMTALPAAAQPQYPVPRGSYQAHCTDIRMNGQFLSATCRGARGGGQSSINVLSCASDIGVDASGALSCAGPGAVAPAPPPAAYAPRSDSDGRRAYRDRDRGWRRGAGAAVLFARPNGRGRSVRIDRDTPDLANVGLNDRVRSIQLEPGSGPWIVCSDAGYRGRCVTIERSIGDVRDIGLRGAVSSLRPAR